MHVTKWKEATWKSYIPYNSVTIWHSGKGKAVESPKGSMIGREREC